MVSQFLNPKNEVAFRKVFGKNKDLCISLLNELLPIDDKIVQIEYFDHNIMPDNPLKRFSAIDILCKDEQNRGFLVEIILFWSNTCAQHSLEKLLEEYSSQLVRVEKNDIPKPVYALCIFNDMFEKVIYCQDNYIYTYQLEEDTHHDEILKDFVFVNLPRFKPQNEEQLNIKELWLTFLRDINEPIRKNEIEPQIFNNELTNKALQELEYFSFTEAEYLRYDRKWDSISIERTLISDAYTRGYKKGFIESIKKEGFDEGVKQTAKNLKSLNLSIDLIIKATGLSEEEIENL